MKSTKEAGRRAGRAFDPPKAPSIDAPDENDPRQAGRIAMATAGIADVKQPVHPHTAGRIAGCDLPKE